MTRATTEDPRRRVAEAACDLVAEGGLENATMRRVATRLGTTTGYISHYFSGKEELLEAALTSALDTVVQTVTGGAAAAGLDGWLTFIEQALPHDPATERFWRVLVAFEAASLASPRLTEVLHTYAADSERRLAEVLAAELPEGTPDRDVRDLARAVWVVVDGIGTTMVINPGALDPSRRRAALHGAVQALIADTRAGAGPAKPEVADPVDTGAADPGPAGA